MYEAFVRIDDSSIFKAQVESGTWNGAAKPWFDKTTVELIIAEFASDIQAFTWDGDVLVIDHEDWRPELDRVEPRVQADPETGEEVKRWPLGNGWWMWEEVPNSSDDRDR